MPIIEQDSIKGVTFAVAATLFWAGNLVIARAYHTEIPPVGLAFLRWMVAVTILTPFLFPLSWKNRHVLWRHKYYLLTCSFLAVTVFNTFVYVAGETVETAGLALVSTSLPVFIVIISMLWLRESVFLNDVIGVCIALAGIITLITGGDWSSLINLQMEVGYVWMITATMSFALYSILLKNKPHELGSWLFLYATFVVGFLLLLPFYIWEIIFVKPTSITAEYAVVIFYLGLFASIGSFYSWNQAVSLLGPKQTAPLYYLIAVFAAFGGWLFLHEPIGWIHLLSMGLIIGGIFLTRLRNKAFRVNRS